MQTKECSVEGCLRPVKCRGFCQAHYVRNLRFGDPGPAEIKGMLPRDRECSLDGCTKKVYSRTWCVRHYENNRLRGDPLTDGRGRLWRVGENKWAGIPCKVGGCPNEIQASGYCSMHYARWLRDGDPGPLESFIAPRGSGTINQNGYREITVDGVRNLEHRHVMASIIGRPLETHENVHHKNGHRADNRPENLELWVTSQPSGQDIRDLVSWAKELLMKYGTLVDEGVL